MMWRRSVVMCAWLASLGCADDAATNTEDGCPLEAPRGSVTLEAFTGGGWEGLRATLSFQRSPDARDAIRCTRQVVGPCAIKSCTNVGIDFVNGEPRCSGASAGAVRIRRARGAELVTDTGTQFTLASPLVPGEELTVRADGRDVPAFEARVSLPERVSVTAPAAFATAGGVTVASGAGLTVRWTPLASRVLVTTRGNNGGDFVAECTFEGPSGEGALPAAALPERAPNVDVTTIAETRLNAGPYPVTVRAMWPGIARASIQR